METDGSLPRSQHTCPYRYTAPSSPCLANQFQIYASNTLPSSLVFQTAPLLYPMRATRTVHLILQSKHCKHSFVLYHLFTIGSFQQPAQPPSSKTTLCRLSLTRTSNYSQLPSISAHRLLQQQPEEAPNCNDRDRDPLIMI